MGEDGADSAPGDAGSVGMDQAAAEAAMDAALAAEASAAAMDAAGGSADLGGFISPQDINVALGYDITPQSMMDLMGVTAATVTAPLSGMFTETSSVQ